MQRDEQRDYEWVYRTGFTSVARTVFLIVNDRAVAEEITQDAFLKLLQKWSVVSDYERPEAWTRKVAVRMAVRYVGRERSRPQRERRAQPLLADPPLPDPDVARAVATLAPMQRAAVALYYWEDRPVLEIARILQVSESTVKQHLHRARARLAETLDEEVSGDVR
ncbi:sigma-70 family RNA polymerase sigma factor [Pedococcus sp. KACC 23699]|uniref:Sigma-70 family RNA polymerase sigma factor n=1 Tax=Pedococcus sp. KACC 23699 TaxID=3149228 RepID=A0AAU7JX35_9MICO